MTNKLPYIQQTLPSHRGAFTLIELLIVISIIGLLVALAMTAVQAAREAARRVQCQNNIRQLALAAACHHDVHKHFPAGFEQHAFEQPPTYRGSPLFAQLLPFLEEGNRLAGWDRDDPLNNALGGDKAQTAAVISVFLCPDDHLPQNPVSFGAWLHGLSSYGGNGGTRVFDTSDATTDGVFHTTGPVSEPRPNQMPVRIPDIIDGTARTLLFGERDHSDTNFETFVGQGWTESLASWGWWGPVGGRRSIGHVALASEGGINDKLSFHYHTRNTASPPADSAIEFQHYVRLRRTAYGSGHSGGANFAFCGGSVQFLADGIEPKVLQALATRHGGESARLE